MGGAGEHHDGRLGDFLAEYLAQQLQAALLQPLAGVDHHHIRGDIGGSLPCHAADEAGGNAEQHQITALDAGQRGGQADFRRDCHPRQLLDLFSVSADGVQLLLEFGPDRNPVSVLVEHDRKTDAEAAGS